MRNDRYDFTADTYSFGVVLVAMLRVDKTVVDFFFKALQRKMRRKSRQGIGIGSLNRYLDKGWRPPLPVELYPGMKDLISRCWAPNPDDRPNFNQIYDELTHKISVEIQNNSEPIFGSGLVIESDLSTLRWDEDKEDMEGIETNRGGDAALRKSKRKTMKAATESLADLLSAERAKVHDLEEEVLRLKKQLMGQEREALESVMTNKAKATIAGSGGSGVTMWKAKSTVVDFEGDGKGEGLAGKAEPTIVDFGNGLVDAEKAIPIDTSYGRDHGVLVQKVQPAVVTIFDNFEGGKKGPSQK